LQQYSVAAIAFGTPMIEQCSLKPPVATAALPQCHAQTIQTAGEQRIHGCWKSSDEQEQTVRGWMPCWPVCKQSIQTSLTTERVARDPGINSSGHCH
jgi:hypothetical protein